MKEKMKEKNKIIVAAVTALCLIALAYLMHYKGVNVSNEQKIVNVGFICEGDESTPFSENFLRVLDNLETEYGDRVNTFLCTNVPTEKLEEVVKDLSEKNCDIIFSNSASFGDSIKAIAEKYPKIQFCQATCSNANADPVCENYHNFMGSIYQGWYLSGKIAGLKLKELIDSGEINTEKALVGFVAAHANAETISSYTAFILGVRFECPTAKMHVKYIHAWADYNLERETAEEMIEKGCVIISHNTDTTGVATACELSRSSRHVYHIGYNLDMINIAPNTSITGSRIDWAPYICSAVEAVQNNKRIEDVVDANIFGQDAGAGFDKGWVKMLDVNHAIAPAESDAVIDETIKQFGSGDVHVFYGDYIAYTTDKSMSYDLNEEYHECSNSSAPSFKGIIRDFIEFE